MKSIVEEASSVTKAIEQGWIRAGKPQEFTIKIFEEAEKNFLGFTKKQAKIAFFFKEQQPKKFTQRSPQEKQQRQLRRQPQQQKSHSISQRRERPVQQRDEKKAISPKTQPSKKSIPQESAAWNNEMVQTANDWIKESLIEFGTPNISFKSEISRYYLKIVFSEPIIKNKEEEQLLFRSWSSLIMQAIRQKHDKPFRGLKVVLNSK